MFTLSATSRVRLLGVHTDLVKVVYRAIVTSPIGFGVAQGLRTAQTEEQLVASGRSETEHSRHLTGHAVDLVALDGQGKADWFFGTYSRLNAVMQAAAAALDIPLEWGGAWHTLKDGDHWQLPWAQYPSTDASVSATRNPGETQ